MTPKLTDRPTLLRHRQRATALFLQEMVADEVQERREEVNRTFTNPLVVTGFPQLWPGLPCIPDDEVLAAAPGAHDLVIHALSLHWADDPVGQLVQCRRAMQPDPPDRHRDAAGGEEDADTGSWRSCEDQRYRTGYP